MREYILNIEFENWENQLWFINEDNNQVIEKQDVAIQNIELLKKSCKEAQEFQSKVISYLKNLGFRRIQK